MPTITGNLDDITGTALTSPRLKFQLNQPTWTGAFIWPTKPVYVFPAVDGSFTVALIETDTMLPAAYYTLTIEWPDASGGYIGADYPTWQLYVPAAGGSIGPLLSTPWNPVLAWYGPTPPPGVGTPNTLWLETDNGVLSIWS